MQILNLEKPYKSLAGKRSAYPMGFLPTFHRYRLNEPAKIKEPQTIFVCSMADLFGIWVPDSWTNTVFEACKAAPQHRYLFLTKNPSRYFELPVALNKDNWWVGTTITGSENKFPSSKQIKCFLSIEPLLQPINGEMDLTDIRWVIIGAETGNRKGKVVPQRAWIEDIVKQCQLCGVPVFMKNNLANIWAAPLIQELPWGGIEN
jgi:protein gp37